MAVNPFNQLPDVQLLPGEAMAPLNPYTNKGYMILPYYYVTTFGRYFSTATGKLEEKKLQFNTSSYHEICVATTAGQKHLLAHRGVLATFCPIFNMNDFELDDDVKVLKELPRTISYNFFLVPAREYKKYFPNEIIDTLEKYPTDEEVEYSEDINIDSLDTDNLKFSEIINILPEVLRTVKRIEGMPEEQIDEYIDDAMNIIIKYRFEIIRSAPKF